MNDKIQNNPSYTKLKSELDGFKHMQLLLELMKSVGLTDVSIDNDILKGVERLSQEFEALTVTPDLFNDFFLEKGWIAHESLHSPLMEECVSLSERPIDKYYCTF